MKVSRDLLEGRVSNYVFTGVLMLAMSAPAYAGETLPFSMDPAVSARQHEVYAVVHAYEAALNRGDTASILDLFTKDAVAEWNDKRTFATRSERRAGYDALFQSAKFTTVFSYDIIDVTGDMAVVRTHHHKGAAVVENGKHVTDLNREVFVLKRVDGAWRIYLYTFNTDPVQGEG